MEIHVKQLLRGTKWMVAPSSRAPRAARRAAMQTHVLTMRMDMSRLAALRLAQSATRAASPAKPKPLSARRAPADTTRLAQLLALVHLVSPTTEASRASRAVRAARLQPAALAPSSATSWNGTTGGNDPNLSSGAIAGISVAVIAVVGDLVDSDRNVGTCIADASDRERCRCAAWSAEVGLRRPPVQTRAYASCRQAAEWWVR